MGQYTGTFLWVSMVGARGTGMDGIGSLCLAQKKKAFGEEIGGSYLFLLAMEHSVYTGSAGFVVIVV